MRIFIASHGDTWDSVAYKTTGNEFLCDIIRQANSSLFSDVVIFEGGERLNIPESIQAEIKTIKTPWET